MSAAVQHAREHAIRRAVERIARATERPLDPRRDDDLRFAANYIADATPEPAAGLPALVSHAIAWHDPRLERLRMIQPFMLPEYPPETPTARPPAPLPHVAGLTFLDSVGAVLAEGHRMSHCIATMRRAGARRASFNATTTARWPFEVHRRRRIRQAGGLGNTSTARPVGTAELSPVGGVLAARRQAVTLMVALPSATLEPPQAPARCRSLMVSGGARRRRVAVQRPGEIRPVRGRRAEGLVSSGPASSRRSAGRGQRTRAAWADQGRQTRRQPRRAAARSGSRSRSATASAASRRHE